MTIYCLPITKKKMSDGVLSQHSFLAGFNRKKEIKIVDTNGRDGTIFDHLNAF